MEQYRHALYRYSTGQGFNVNVNPPKKADDVNSFKLDPLRARLIHDNYALDLHREADRVSYQAEAAAQQLKILGYDRDAGKRYRNLKARVDVVRHLMTHFPIRYIVKKDLEKIYELSAKTSPGQSNATLDAFIQEIVEKNKGVTDIKDYVDTAEKLRKGYPLFDQFGRKLGAKDNKILRDSKAKHKGQGLGGFGEGSNNKLFYLLVAGIIAAFVLKAGR